MEKEWKINVKCCCQWPTRGDMLHGTNRGKQEHLLPVRDLWPFLGFEP